MTFTEKIKDTAQEIVEDPGVIDGAIQIMTAIGTIIIRKVSGMPNRDPKEKRLKGSGKSPQLS